MGRPRKDEPGVSRERILDVAAALFRDQGYERTSLAAIGDKLGVSAAALYYHFSSKQEILAAYLEEGLEGAIHYAERAMDASAPSDRLRQVVRASVLFELGQIERSGLSTYGAYGFDQLARSLSDDEQRRLQKIQRGYLGLLRTVIEEGIEAGELSSDNVTAAAFAITGMAAHCTQWFRTGSELTVTELADQYAEYAVRMLSKA